jgi:peptidoglycan glycosyltransferase
LQPPSGPTLADAVVAACPAALAQIGQRLGAQALERAFSRWGLNQPPPLEIPTEAGEVQVTDPRLAAVGQEDLTVTPLHVALAVAALGNEGTMPAAALVLKTENIAGPWQPAKPVGQATQVIDAGLAERLRSLLRPSAQDDQVVGHGSIALAGADRPPLAWYIGLAPAPAPRYAVAVLLEHSGDDGPKLAEQVGVGALVTAFSRPP